MNREIIIDKNMRELNPQGDFSFPFNLLNIVLSMYPFCSFPAHWHPEIEVTYVVDGEMTYIANQKSFHLRKGDILFVNANVLHAGEQYQNSDCTYYCFCLDPLIIHGFEHSRTEGVCINPLVQDVNFSYALFNGEKEEYGPLRPLIEKLIKVTQAQESGYELLIQGILCEFWYYVFRYYQDYLTLISRQNQISQNVRNKQRRRLKNSLALIYDNYTEPITLAQIAAASHTSKSEFCRLFKKTLHQTPFDFLLQYRIEKSLPLLRQEDFPITEIAIQAGFSGPSYYAEVFRKYMRCSPSQYRKNYLQSVSNHTPES